MTIKPTEDDLLALFTRADLGGDEQLDLMEFGMVLDSLGMSWSKAQVQDRFERADTNRDGLISYPEFRALLDAQVWDQGGLEAAHG